MKKGRWSSFFLDVRSEPNTIPLQSRVTVAALYVVAVVAFIAIPYNFILDLRDGASWGPLVECVFLVMVVVGLVSFWITRRLRYPRLFYFLGVSVLCVQLIVEAGGVWGMGALYVVCGYSVIYFVLGLRGALLIPLLLLAGTLVRLQWGHFSDISIFNSPDLTTRYMTILSVASVLGVVTVAYQHFLVANLTRVAYVDPISGLASRFRIEEYLQDSLKRAHLHHRKLSIIALKIQHFSQVNSTQGSARADQILGQIGQRLQALTGLGTLTCRYSGTLFLVVTPEWETPRLEALGQRLYHHITLPYVVEGQSVTLACEVAVTRYPDDGEDAERLMSNLFTTLNHTPGLPGQVVFFDQSQAEADQHRFALGEELRHAIDRGEFSLVYHPKLHLPSGRCRGAEVLLRWDNRTHGVVGPDQFIPLAEETGKIREITRWVISQSFREISTLDKDLVHAINLSPLDLSDPTLLDFIDAELAAGGLQPRNIEFEITEGVLMDNNATIQDVLESLRNRGYRLAIDDFGTGYSSLSYLTRLRVNNLKIDQSFIRPLEDPLHSGTTAKHRIVEAVISMARALSLDITAEGVETPAQADYLTMTGCTYVQGWLYSKPVPLDVYKRWLKSKAVNEDSYATSI